MSILYEPAFETAIRTVLINEDGYVNDPNDPGGETKYGISKKSYPALDIKNLTLDEARAIYHRDFWNPDYNKITHQSVVTKILDMSVNLGPVTAIRLVQAAAGVPIDGVFGPVTLEAVNNPSRLIKFLLELRSQHCYYYAGLIADHVGNVRYSLGWMRRGVQ